MVVASVQSLGRPDTSARRLRPYVQAWLPPPPPAAAFSSAMQQGPKQRDVLVVVDEAHHITPDSTYDTVLSAFELGSAAAAGFKTGRMGEGGVVKGPRAFLFGFTATPFRWVRVCFCLV